MLGKRHFFWSRPSTFFQSHELGAALLEVIVAIGIVTMVMTTIVSLVSVSLKSASLSQSQTLGTKYSQEGMESMRQMRNLLGWDGLLARLTALGNPVHYCLATIPQTLAQFNALPNAVCTSAQFVDAKNLFQRQATITVTVSGSSTTIAINVTTTWNDSGVTKQSVLVQSFQQYTVADAPSVVTFTPLPYGYTPIPTPSPIPSPSPSPTPRVELGFVVATCNNISGWTCDNKSYTTPLSVDLYTDAYDQAHLTSSTIQANTSYTPATMAQYCGSNLYHGFSYNFNNLSNGNHTLYVNGNALNTGGVPDTSLQFALNDGTTGHAPTTVACYRKGSVTATCTGVSGWSCDSDNYNLQLSNDVYLDTYDQAHLLSSSITGGAYDANAAAACGGNGYHAFAYSYPYLTGGTHSIYTLGNGLDQSNTSNTSFQFPISDAATGLYPSTVSCTRYQKGYVTATCGHVTGWACDSNNYSTPLTVALYDGVYSNHNIVNASIPASAGCDPGVAAVCGGNCYHSFDYTFAPLSGGPHTLLTFGNGLDASGQPSGNNQYQLIDTATGVAGQSKVLCPLPTPGVYASATLAGSSPSNVLDNNPATFWSSGGFASQYIAFVFPYPVPISGMNLTVLQFPAGATVHRILMGNAWPAPTVYTFSGNGSTSDGQVLTAKFGTPITAQYVWVFTDSSPSWVGWKDISFY